MAAGCQVQEMDIGGGEGIKTEPLFSGTFIRQSGSS